MGSFTNKRPMLDRKNDGRLYLLKKRKRRFPCNPISLSNSYFTWIRHLQHLERCCQTSNKSLHKERIASVESTNLSIKSILLLSVYLLFSRDAATCSKNSFQILSSPTATYFSLQFLCFCEPSLRSVRYTPLPSAHKIISPCLKRTKKSSTNELSWSLGLSRWRVIEAFSCIVALMLNPIRLLGVAGSMMWQKECYGGGWSI